MKREKIIKIIEELFEMQPKDISRMAVGGSLTTSNNDNSSPFPVKVTLFVRRDGLNTYYIKTTVTSRWSNYNEYGMVAKVCSDTSGSKGSEWSRATKKPFRAGQTLITEKTVNVTYSGTFYGMSKCMHCEYTTPHNEKFSEVTPGISYTYVKPDITPGAPSLTKPSNASFNDGTYTVYAGGDISFVNLGGSNVASRKLHLECYYPSSGWSTWTANSGWNAWSGSSNNLGASFSGTGSNRGYIYRVTPYVKSSTGHEAHGETYYFKVNDYPSISGFGSNVSETQSSVTISHNGISDAYNKGLVTKYYSRKSGGSWQVITSNGGNSLTLSISNYCSPGEVVEFGAQPFDGLEWGEMVAGVRVKRIEVYSKPTIVISPTKPESFEYNSTTTYAGDNLFRFSVGNSSSYYQSLVNMGYYDKSGTWHYYNPSGFNSWQSSPTPSFTFDADDRGLKWGVQAQVKSKSGNVTQGDWKYFYINDLPVSNYIASDSLRVNSTVGISISDATDKINKSGHKHKIEIAKKIGSSYFVIGEGYNEKITIDISKHVNEGEYLSIHARAKDYLEFGHWKDVSVKIKRNSKPYFNSGDKITSDKDNSTDNYYFNETMALYFPPIKDVDTTANSKYKVFYRIYNKNQWEGWNLLTTRTSSTYHVDLSEYCSRGNKIQFKVRALDDLNLESTTEATSPIYTRIHLIDAPTEITLNSSSFKDNHYEKLESVSWTNMNNVPNNSVKKYVCTLSRVNANGVILSEAKYESTTTTSPVSLLHVERGERFVVRVKTIDKFGNESKYNSTGIKTRNEVPATVENFKTEHDRLNHYLTVDLIWDHSSDPDGDTFTYEISSRIHGANWTVIAPKVSNRRYSHNIENYTPGQKLGYKIVAIDELGARGKETIIKNSDSITVNIPPTGCKLYAPFTKNIYASKPRILINSVEEIVTPENGLILELTVDGNTYTSTANTSMFNKSKYQKDDKAIFRTPIELTPGAHIVKGRTFDGLQYSPYTQSIININRCLERERNTDEPITSQSMNNLATMVNSNIVAYKEPAVTNAFVQGTKITAKDFNKIETDIYNLSKKITTSYTGLPDSHENIKVVVADKITTNIFNNILKIISNP